jgi:hypothetical protein
VVGRPDDLTGEAIVAFVVLKGARPTGDAAVAMIKELQNWVGQEIGPIAKPKDIRFGENLPKTRSGKIMRRLLRQLAKGEEITQDTSTLENPAILEQLKCVTSGKARLRTGFFMSERDARTVSLVGYFPAPAGTVSACGLSQAQKGRAGVPCDEDMGEMTL